MNVEAPSPTRSRENTRARLLEAAHAVFGEVGLDAASVESVCERAGFTRGAFYSNFESKEELFLALVEQVSHAGLDAVDDRVRALAPDADPDPAALVREVVGVSISGLEPRLATELRTQALRDERIAAAFLTLQDGVVERVRGIVVGVAERYGLRFRMPVDQLARLMVEVAEATCERAEIEGLSGADVSAALNVRLEQLATVLVDR